MQSIRINNRLPQVYRVYTKAAPAYYNTRAMPLFQRFAGNEFASVFNLLDDFANHVASSRSNACDPAFSKLSRFQPRFDVKEDRDSYELHGELPGIEQSDISIEFTDAQTLSIKGRTEQSRGESTGPASLVDGEDDKAPIAEGSDGLETDGSYHKATVEDESTVSGTDSEAVEAPKQHTEAETQTQIAQPKAKDESRYWVSERSIGEFARTFSFPSRVNQEKVKASLKNGILSISIPKATAPVFRRINIE